MSYLFSPVSMSVVWWWSAIMTAVDAPCSFINFGRMRSDQLRARNHHRVCYVYVVVTDIVLLMMMVCRTSCKRAHTLPPRLPPRSSGSSGAPFWKSSMRPFVHPVAWTRLPFLLRLLLLYQAVPLRAQRAAGHVPLPPGTASRGPFNI